MLKTAELEQELDVRRSHDGTTVRTKAGIKIRVQWVSGTAQETRKQFEVAVHEMRAQLNDRAE